jgi:hypothetical protein
MTICTIRRNEGNTGSISDMDGTSRQQGMVQGSYMRRI